MKINTLKEAVDYINSIQGAEELEIIKDRKFTEISRLIEAVLKVEREIGSLQEFYLKLALAKITVEKIYNTELKVLNKPGTREYKLLVDDTLVSCLEIGTWEQKEKEDISKWEEI